MNSRCLGGSSRLTDNAYPQCPQIIDIHLSFSFFLSYSLSQRQSKRTHLHLISPSSFKEGPGVTERTGIIVRKLWKANIQLQITSPTALGEKGSLSVYIWDSIQIDVCMCTCWWICQLCCKKLGGKHSLLLLDKYEKNSQDKQCKTKTECH